MRDSKQCFPFWDWIAHLVVYILSHPFFETLLSSILVSPCVSLPPSVWYAPFLLFLFYCLSWDHPSSSQRQTGQGLCLLCLCFLFSFWKVLGNMSGKRIYLLVGTASLVQTLSWWCLRDAFYGPESSETYKEVTCTGISSCPKEPQHCPESRV